ncbi:hypothetical protein K9M41_04475, partial [Candidatus Gracilibacteria bacterium]|nr:hypothetical protein [Candidatus Gracilibacteria bacterium]
YFVSTVGINEAIIKKYIEEQGKEDFGQAELELGGSHGSTDPWRPSLTYILLVNNIFLSRQGFVINLTYL